MSTGVEVAAFVEAFGQERGDLPDGEILGSSDSDWQLTLDHLHASGWAMNLSDDGSAVPSDQADLARLEAGSFSVWPRSGLRINFFFWDATVIFDIDLREFATQDAADGLCELMSLLGRATGKDVVITPEGTDSRQVLSLHTQDSDFHLTGVQPQHH